MRALKQLRGSVGDSGSPQIGTGRKSRGIGGAGGLAGGWPCEGYGGSKPWVRWWCVFVKREREEALYYSGWSGSPQLIEIQSG